MRGPTLLTMYLAVKLHCLQLILQHLDLSIIFECERLDVLLACLLELLVLAVVLLRRLLKMFALCSELPLEFVDPAAVHVLQPHQLGSELFILECYVLVLVQDVVLTKLQL